MRKKKFNPNETYYGPGYQDPEKPMMVALGIFLMIVLVAFLAWAIR